MTAHTNYTMQGGTENNISRNKCGIIELHRLSIECKLHWYDFTK